MSGSTPIGYTKHTPASTSTTNVFSYTGTAGNSLVLKVNFNANTTCTVADSKGNSYTSIFGPSTGSGNAYLAVFLVSVEAGSGSNTITVTFGTTCASTAYLSEWPTLTFDKASTVKGAFSTAMSINSATPAQSNELAILFSGNAGATGITASSWTGGFTPVDSTTSAPSGEWASQIAGSGAVSGGATLSTSTNWSSVLVLFTIGGSANTYTRIQQVTDNYNYDVEAWWCQNVVVTGSPFTLNLSTNLGSSKNLFAVAYEVSGLTGVDRSNTAQGTAATSLVVSNPGANTGAADFVATAVSVAYGSSALSDPPSGGATWTSSYTGGSGGPVDFGYRTNSGVVTDSASWTWTTANNAGAVIASFLSASSSVVQSLPFHIVSTSFQGTFVSPPTLGNSIVIVCIINGGISGNTFNLVSDNYSGGGGGGSAPRMLLLGVG